MSPTVGWKWASWEIERPCVRCDRTVVMGYINPNDDEDDPIRALCCDCKDEIFATETPEDFPQ